MQLKVAIDLPLMGVLITVAFLLAPEFVLAGYCGYGESAYYSQSPYYSQGSYQTVFTKNASEAVNFTVTGTISKGSGTFVIDHPLDPRNKLLFHSFVESPDVKNLYDGIVTLNRNGEAAIQLPDYFEALNKDFRYQLKPIGRSMPNLYVKDEVKNNRFAIAGGASFGRVSWQVTGIRHDPYILANPLVPEVPKGSDQPVVAGKYLFSGSEPEGLASLTNLFSSFTDFVRGLFTFRTSVE